MRHILFLLIYPILIFLVFVSCQDDVESVTSSDLYIASFSASHLISDSVMTRATDLKFNEGDEIGIYVVRKEGVDSELLPEGNFADNKRYVIDRNGNLKPVGKEDQIYLSKKESYAFYAYYPYTYNMNNPTNFWFYTELDQSVKENYVRADVMCARNLSGVNNGGILLQFERKLALVELYFNKASGKTISSALMNVVKSTFILNLGKNEVVTYKNNEGCVKMNLYQENNDYYIFRALLPEQELQGEYLFEFVIDGEVIQYKATSTTPLCSGRKSMYLLNMQYRILAHQRDAGTGMVQINKEIFNHGETVHIKAIPEKNYYFEGWYESPLVGWQEYLSKVTDSFDYSFTATKPVWYIAVFKPIEHFLGVKIVTEGGGVGGTIYGGNRNERQGASTSVWTESRYGFNFVGWYENDILMSTNPVYNFTMPDHPLELEARFKRNLITVTIDCYPSKEILAPYYNNPAQIVRAYGDIVTLYGNLVSDSPYVFDGWYENEVYLNRDYAYIFAAETNRTLLAKYGLRVFSLGEADASTTYETPGYFTNTFNSRHPHSVDMRAGQKIRLTGNVEYQEFVTEHSIPFTISGKELVVKIGERVIYRTNEFEDFIFTAPENGTYTFHYSMILTGRLLSGERAKGTMVISRAAWFID